MLIGSRSEASATAAAGDLQAIDGLSLGAGANADVAALAGLAGLRGLHAGALVSAPAAEAPTSVLIFMNKH